MRRIVKRKPGPSKLLEHRKRNGRYGDLPPEAKEQTRTALLEDQGHLCCYCMRCIHAEKHWVRIEHHDSQSAATSRDLDWDNLLAACSGADKARPRRGENDAAARRIPRPQQTCDYRKGDERITINPLTRSVDAITYLPTGRLLHPDERLQEDIDERLNLNATFLVDARKAARNRLIEGLQAKLGGTRLWTKDQLTRYLDGLRRKPRLDAFIGVLERELEHQIAKRAR